EMKNREAAEALQGAQPESECDKPIMACANEPVGHAALESLDKALVLEWYEDEDGDRFLVSFEPDVSFRVSAPATNVTPAYLLEILVAMENKTGHKDEATYDRCQLEQIQEMLRSLKLVLLPKPRAR